jgi:hypothetical protein
MALNDMLYGIDPNTMLLGLLFIIFYVLINFSLTKVLFKKEKASSTIVSLCVSLLAVYGINRTNLNISGMFSKIGVNDTIIYAVVPWIILGLAVLASFTKDKTTGKRSFRLYRLLMVLGAFLLLLSFFAYQQMITLIAGIILIVLGLLLWIKVKNKNSQVQGRALKSGNLFLWILFLALIALGIYAVINNITYLIIGAAVGLLIVGILLFKKKINLAPSGQSQSQGSSKQGQDYLIRAAKKFHDWAVHQPNPKFSGNWAMFIKYLGGNEEKICQRLGVSKNDFVGIFNEYGLVKK